MKTRIVVLLFIAVLSAVCIGAYRMNKYMKQVRSLPINRVDLTAINDGTYNGTFDLQLVKTVVDVTIANHRIAKIDIIEHENGRGKKAESIIDSVIARQQVDVDVIAGATASSKALLKAIEIALTKK